MTAIIMKFLSAFMSIVVFLSGAFPALFGGKVFIDPDGDRVTIVDDVDIGDENLIISDFESFKALGVTGLSYDEEFFKENSLAASTFKLTKGDELYITSITVDGRNAEMKYLVDPYDGLAAQIQLYMPDIKTVFIEVDKDVVLLKTTDIGNINLFFPS